MPLPPSAPPLSHLLPRLDGAVADDDATLARFARDWGGLVHTRPSAVVRPAHTADVAAVLAFATDAGIAVAPRGTGHSAFGQSQAEAGIVLDLGGLRRVHPGQGTALVADGGATWRRVTDSALARGLTPEVLPDSLDLSVGGTLSVGGLGGASHRHGAQTDLVTELEVVTGAGEVVRCSAHENAALFDAVRAGLGQCGVITRATLALGRARGRVRRRKLYYRDLEAFLADQRTVVADERFDQVEGRALPDDSAASGGWSFRLDATTTFTLPTEANEDHEAAVRDGLSFDPETAEVAECGYGEFCDRMAPGAAAQRESGDWYRPHPWLTVLLPDDAVAEVVEHTLADLPGLGASGLVLLYPLRAERITTPLLRLPRGDREGTVWLFAVLDVADPHDPVALARRLERHAEWYGRATAAGGTLYPSGALPHGTVDWTAHFGDAWERFENARHRFDPAGVLAPGQRIFTAACRSRE
ncbi:FAD-binding protein [Saccharomonospora piscinae]|uniref:FAD-binding protein n=1 Tax=Saccharomonospora piscinae TaxID=687388 RepID=UPI0004640D4A|nr:FAD-binding protein [Saccharomonospora piscinae]